MTKGKLIVFEGIDSSGKTTQAKLLVHFLEKLKFRVKYFNFPQYHQSFYGAMIGQYLKGKFGDANDISPYLASLIYAFDRLSAKEKIEDYLKKGEFVIANRYVPSNIAHQGSKLTSEKEREEFIHWLFELEYRVNHVPREDLVIFLHLPWQVAAGLAKSKGLLDLHEKDLSHQQAAENIYLDLARKNPNWIKINSAPEGQILPPLIIHQKIILALKDRGII